MEWGLNNTCYGCGGGCCENVRLALSDANSTSSFGDLAPHVINPEQAISLKDVPKTEGVYYVYGKRAFYLEIIGRCPELQSDGKCAIINGRRAKGCNDLQPNDGFCFSRKNS